MEEQRNEFPLQRNFKCLKIVWEIENSFCVTHQKKWEICSPSFTVKYSVPLKWRFILTDFEDESDAEYAASIHVLRHDMSDTDLPVRVSCKLSFESFFISNIECVFYQNSKVSSKINNFDRLREKLKNSSVRKFNIEALFLVTGSEDNVEYGRTNDVGLRSLSENIGNLFTSKLCCDLTVNIARAPFVGHKSILSARNKLLSDIIVHNSVTNTVSVGYADAETAENIFRYLYSGNLDYVLRMPSISMQEAIQFFKIKELEKYYMNDEVNLRTKFEVREYYHQWNITDIDTNSNLSFYSPFFRDRNLNINLQMRLDLQDVGTNGHIGIFLDGSFPQEWKELFIVFEVIEKHSHRTNIRKAVRWSREYVGAPGIEDFFPRNILNKIYTEGNDSLRISTSLLVPINSVPSSSLVSVRCCLPACINAEEHYTLLSKQIESLLDSGKYSDFTIRCGDKQFPVHKCVLTTRSSYFTQGRRLSTNPNELSLEGTDTAILEIILRYVYSGVLEVNRGFDLYEISKAAEKLGVFILKHQCMTILKANPPSKVFDALFEAHINKNVEVKSAIFKYLMDNRREFRDQSMWAKLMNEKDLYEEFNEYLRTQVRNNPEAGLQLND